MRAGGMFIQMRSEASERTRSSALGIGPHGRIGELDEGGARHHQGEGLVDELEPGLERLGEQRQAGHHGGGRLRQMGAEHALEAIGIALHHGGGRIALAQQLAEGRIVLEQDEAGRIDALRHQGFGHRTGAGPELDHRALGVGVHIGRHGARQRLAGRGHGADGEGLLDPGSDEAHLVVERNTVFLFLETAEVALDLLFDSAALQLEQPNLFLEFLFEELESRQRHRG